MATEKQILANRENAKRSRGPTTAEGKERSRRNALKHGLTGAGVVLPEEEAEAVADRVASWAPSLAPRNEYEEWLLERICLESIRLDRCHRHEITLRGLQVARAETRWDEDRRLAAEELGERLRKAPARVALLLRGTAQGSSWLRARWEGLGRVLEERGDWDESQRALALDLMGVPPEFRSGLTPIDPAPGADATAFRRERIASQIADLAASEADSLEALDDLERSAAVDGLGAEVSPPLALLHRYERACSRRLDLAFARLRSGRPGGGGGGAGARSAIPDASGLADLDEILRTEFRGPGPLPPPPPPRAADPAPAPALPRAETIAVSASKPAAPSPSQPPLFGAPVSSHSAPIFGNRHERRAQLARARHA